MFLVFTITTLWIHNLEFQTIGRNYQTSQFIRPPKNTCDGSGGGGVQCPYHGKCQLNEHKKAKSTRWRKQMERKNKAVFRNYNNNQYEVPIVSTPKKSKTIS